MAVSKQPGITPDTSSGEGLDEEPTSRGEAKWKRFHPLRVVRKIFRRRIKRDGSNVVSEASKKSWSTSELQSVQDDSAGKCDVTSPLKIGLSVSHDSIFSPENNTNIVSNEALEIPHPSSLSVRHTSMKNMFKDELFIRIRARRDSEDDGIGMQSSPYSSPTTLDVLNQGFKENLPKSETTYSAGSLLSMGSSENDEDSTGHSSGHSSRMSLLDRKSLDSEGDLEGANPVPLNHTAAHHKISVRPKRTYGLPRSRMKQVAASKVASLPSTPEVTEDLNKCLQNLEVTEITKYTSECTDCPLTPDSSTEQNASFNFNNVSFSETSQFTSEIIEKSIIETTETNLETSSRSILSSEISHEFTEFAITKNEEKTETRMVERHGRHQKTVPDIFNDCKQNLDNKNENNEMESYKLIKNILQDKPKCDLLEDIAANSEESVVGVASIVKSITKSDSFKNADKTKQTLGKKTEDSFENKQTNDFKENDIKNSDELISGSMHSNSNDEFSDSISYSRSQDLRIPTTDCVNELFKKNTIPEKLDIDSEFVLKPVKKDRRFSGDRESANKDVVVEKQKDNSVVSSVYLEEESIMSNKSLSIGVEERQLFVSHHTSYSDDHNDILVTEAHNYAAVDKKSKMPIPPTEGAISNNEKNINEQYVSSVGLSTSDKSNFSSSPTTLSDKKVSEDKVTISVNPKSKCFKLKLISPKNEDVPQISVPKTSLRTTDSDIIHKVGDKQLKQVDKSYLPDISSSSISVKNANSQKRVSVEIVPFSQRMKERKYQPVTYANKEGSSENKKNSSVVVERKLSDRKVSKNKELDKSSNRHSFSGIISSESKKDDDSMATIKEIKKEKVQYPVQIRIHKSNLKPEVKVRNSISQNEMSELKHSKKDNLTDVQHRINPGKIIQHEVKHLREEDKTVECAPKWEIKIQPASLHANTPEARTSEEKNCSTKGSILRSESFKSTQSTGSDNKDVDLETSLTKSQDNSWKSSKDSSSVSDDPEPELLRVFARRSIKQKHCDKSKTGELEKLTNYELQESMTEASTTEVYDKNKEMVSVSLCSTVIKISENAKPHITKPDLKKKSKSFCEKEKVPRSVSPLKEMNLIHRESTRSSIDCIAPSENSHPKQRFAKVEDAALTLPLENEKKNSNRMSQNESMEEYSLMLMSKEEQLHKSSSMSTPPSSSVNGSFNLGMVKENQDMIAGKDAHAPSWLQLAQQRRELREQRERLLLGGSPNSFMDGSSKPSRSSKVWDMVNNFQKLQMT